MKLRYLADSEAELKELKEAMEEFSKYYNLAPVEEGLFHVSKTIIDNKPIKNSLDISASPESRLDYLYSWDPHLNSNVASPPRTLVEKVEPFSKKPHLSMILGEWRYNIYFTKKKERERIKIN